MKFGVCASYQLAATISPEVDFIEDNVRRVLNPEADPHAIDNSALKAIRTRFEVFSANGFLPPDMKVIGPNADGARISRYARIAFERAATAGIRVIVFGSPDSRSIPPGVSQSSGQQQFVSVLRGMAADAANAGVIVALEPLNRSETNLVNSVSEGAEMVREVGHPAVRLHVDLYHMLIQNEDPCEISNNIDLIVHTHVAEVRDRSAPGVHGDDFRPFLRALTISGYSGGMAVECRWNDLRAESETGIQTLRSQLASVL